MEAAIKELSSLNNFHNLVRYVPSMKAILPFPFDVKIEHNLSDFTWKPVWFVLSSPSPSVGSKMNRRVAAASGGSQSRHRPTGVPPQT